MLVPNSEVWNSSSASMPVSKMKLPSCIQADASHDLAYVLLKSTNDANLGAASYMLSIKGCGQLPHHRVEIEL